MNKLRYRIAAGALVIMMVFGCNVSKKKGIQYVGSKNSDKYHVEECRWAKNIKAENVVRFEDDEKAISAGYKPCKTCIRGN